MHARPLRADAVRNRAIILEATNRVFRASDDGRSVSVGQIAEAAQVGKGTVFRHFTDRAGLLSAVVAAKSADLRALVESDDPRLGSAAKPRQRVLAMLTEIVKFKLSHRQLVEAMEENTSPTSPGGLYTSEPYRWVHGQLTLMLTDLGGVDATYMAHALLSLVRADLLLHLRTTGATDDEVVTLTGKAASRLMESVTPS